MRLTYALVLALVTVAVHASTASAQLSPPVAQPAMRLEPSSGGPGTVIKVRSVDPCPLAETGEGVRVHALLAQHESPILDEGEGPVGEDGHWNVELVVPDASELHSEGLAITATCYLPGPAPIDWYYEHSGFTYTGPTGGEDAPSPTAEDGQPEAVPASDSQLPATGAGFPGLTALALLVMALAMRQVVALAQRRW